MAGFLYFIPDVEQGAVNDALIQQHGLTYALGRGRTVCGVRGVFGGRNGVVVGDHKRIPPEKVRFDESAQTWRKIPKSECQVGYYTEDPPKPQELILDSPLDGHLVTLGDGQSYMIPVALVMEEAGPRSSLPVSTDVDDDGNWVPTGVMAAYRGLSEIAWRIWESFGPALIGADKDGDEESPKEVRFDFDETRHSALAALSANYAVDKAEVALLGLFSDRAPNDILLALMDWPGFLALLKKKAAGSSVSGT